MRTVQMTLDDKLVQQVDIIARGLHLTRSAFTREALRKAIECYNIRCLEERHRQGYEKHPVKKDEFEAWKEEQAWGDE